MKPTIVIPIFIVLILSALCFTQTLHVNNVQDLQIIQSITGEVTVRKEAGWYSMVCPRIWTYPKAGVYQLNAKDKDLLDIQFKNKSTAKIMANIGYRIDGASNDVLIALHQQVKEMTRRSGGCSSLLSTQQLSQSQPSMTHLKSLVVTSLSR